MKRSEPPILGRHLVIVHNVDSGLLNRARAAWRRIVGPNRCALCALTRGVRGVNPRWQQFLDSQSEPVHDMNRDQFRAEHAPSSWRSIDVPAILLQTGSSLDRVVGANEIRKCENLRELMEKVEEGIRKHPPHADV